MDTEMKEDLSLTDLLFFDTDVLSSFLCIDEEYLLPLLYKNRIVVSNNLRDVKGFIDLYDLRHMTTASILKEAYDKRIISEEQGNRIWTTMIDEKRKIGPYQDFTSYLDSIS